MCTGLRYVNGDFYFGRNLDLDYHFGEEIVITPRNYEITYKNEPSQKSHYAFIGVAMVLDNYPLYADAINEKGLGIANLNFPQFSKYADEIKEGALNLPPYELVPWVLAQFSTVKETKAALKNLNMVDIPFKPNVPNTTLHWLIADKDEAIVVEIIDGKTVIYDNPVGVLTNSPSFDYHLMNLHNYRHLSSKQPHNSYSPDWDAKPFGEGFGAIGLPGDWSPASRLVKATFVKEHSVCPQDDVANVTQFFHILDSVAFVQGCTTSDRNTHDITMYSSCGNAATGDYYYKTYTNNQISKVSMSKVDLESTKLFVYPMEDKQQYRQVN